MEFKCGKASNDGATSRFIMESSSCSSRFRVFLHKYGNVADELELLESMLIRRVCG